MSRKKIEPFSFEPIGVMHTSFKEKFGIPRQPGLTSGAKGLIKLQDHDFYRQALRELEGFSHLWVIWVFHRHAARNWKPSIRPPRLGGARKVGVLASRSPHRPNPIGLSAVKLERVDVDAEGGPEVHVSGVDILDGTPVLDIKPYVAYADSIPNASSGWADEPIERFPVEFTTGALLSIEAKGALGYPNLKELIDQMLALDPRPAFQKRKLPIGDPKAEGTQYGFLLHGFDVKWEIRGGRLIVLDVIEAPTLKKSESTPGLIQSRDPMKM